MLKRILLLSGTVVTVLLLWFAVGNYRAALPMAEENLHGLALSLADAVENIVEHDPSLNVLAALHPKELAFIALVDHRGVYRFHSNPDLIGTKTTDNRYLEVVQRGQSEGGRVVLGTGENAYELDTPLHLPTETLSLRLVLHTYRADAVVRRARLNIALILILLATGWALAVVVYRFALREEQHREEMARRENLARLGEMGAMLAHEIRNPLAGIKGYAQLIERKPQDERAGEFAQRIVGQAVRLETLIGELLSYARSERARLEPLNLAEVIRSTAELILPETATQGVELDCDCPDRLQVLGDRDRLSQVLLNLAKNALQAMPEGGRLRIASSEEGANVTIRVSDSGAGIKAEDLARVFEPFFTTKARGTGLGLALCKKVIEEHHGEIALQSSAGAGTTCLITLPGNGRGTQRSEQT